jgi:hypothetical protein
VCQQSIRGEGQSGLLTHRDDGKRFVVLADEKLTAFMELRAAILNSLRGSDIRINS